MKTTFRKFLNLYREANGSIIGLQYKTDGGDRLREIVYDHSEIGRRISNSEGSGWTGSGTSMSNHFLDNPCRISIFQNFSRSVKGCKRLDCGWFLKVDDLRSILENEN